MPRARLLLPLWPVAISTPPTIAGRTDRSRPDEHVLASGCSPPSRNIRETQRKTKPEGRYGTAFEAAVSVAAKLTVPGQRHSAATPARRRRQHRRLNPDATLEQRARRLAACPRQRAAQDQRRTVLERACRQGRNASRSGHADGRAGSQPRPDLLAPALAVFADGTPAGVEGAPPTPRRSRTPRPDDRLPASPPPPLPTQSRRCRRMTPRTAIRRNLRPRPPSSTAIPNRPSRLAQAAWRRAPKRQP